MQIIVLLLALTMMLMVNADLTSLFIMIVYCVGPSRYELLSLVDGTLKKKYGASLSSGSPSLVDDNSAFGLSKPQNVQNVQL
jgi:hypothetical protein